MPAPDDNCSVKLPETGYELRAEGRFSPLASATALGHRGVPGCGADARRDIDTIGTFVDSSRYYLRFPSPNYTDGPFVLDGIRRWVPVDRYIGGKKHTPPATCCTPGSSPRSFTTWAWCHSSSRSPC